MAGNIVVSTPVIGTWPYNASINPDDAANIFNNITITAINGATLGATNDRMVKVGVKALTGAALHAAVQAWQNPESVSIIITKVIVDVTTVATGAAKVDVGTTATSATTASDNLIDGIDVNAATGLLGQADGDGVVNSKLQQKLAAGKWVTFKEISGDVTGLVANCYITYILA